MADPEIFILNKFRLFFPYATQCYIQLLMMQELHLGNFDNLAHHMRLQPS